MNRVERIIKHIGLSRPREEALMRLKLLQEVRADIDTTMNLDQVLPRILDTGLRLVGVETGSIMLLNQDGDLEFKARREGPAPLPPDKKLRSFKVGEGIAGWVALYGQPALVADVTRDRRLAPPGPGGKLLFRSLLSVPIKPADTAIGVINADHPNPDRFTETDLRLLSDLADQVLIALGRAGLVAASQALQRAAIEHASLPEFLREVANITRRLLFVPACVIRLLDERTQQLKIAATAGLDQAQMAMVERLDVDALQRAMTASEDGRAELITELGLVPGFIVMMGMKELAQGTIEVYTSAPRRFTPWEQNFFRVFADQVAGFIENAKLLEQEVNRLASLHAVGQSLTRMTIESRSQLGDILQKIANQALTVSGADIVTLYQYYEAGNKFVTPPTIGGKKNLFQGQPMTTEIYADDVVARIARLGKPHWATDAQADALMYGTGIRQPKLPGEEERPRFVIREKVKSSAGIPLKVGDEVVGVMFFNYRTSYSFPNDVRRFLETFANNAAIAIQNARQYDALISSRRQFEKLNEIMQAMTEARNVNDLLELILDKGLELVGSTRGWISRLDFRTGELGVVVYRGEPPELRPLQLGQGITGRALQTGKPIRADDVLDSRWRGIYEPFWADTRSELAVPILINNAEVRVRRRVELASKPIGVINVESPISAAFTQANEDILWSLARQAAIMIDRLELERKLAHLARIQHEIIRKQDWDDIIQIFIEAITKTLEYEYVNISLVKPGLNRIATEYVTGIPENEKETFKRLADHALGSDDIQADVVRSRQIEVPDLGDDRFDPKVYKRFHHDRLIRVFLPMIASSDNRVMGTVEAGYQRKYRRYIYEQDVQILKGFVDYAVRALEQRQRGLLDRVSHESRAPIVGIRSNASFLQRRIAELDHSLVQHKFDDILTDCEILLLQVKELEHILGRTLPPPKIERTLVFRDIIIKTVRQLKPLVREHGFDISKIEYDSADIHKINPIHVDKAQLNQVVYNLLINSIKYAKDDPKAFAIRIEVDEIKNAFIIKFKDWGIGIRQELAEKVFEEGFRTPEAIQKYVTGSGLGLTIARKIMRELGGDLRLANTSEPTEFHLMLPKSLEECQMIVLVDDEKREMDSYVMELELAKYEVSFHKDVDAALKFIQENLERIDLLILDIMMPPGSSFEDVNTNRGLRTGIHFYTRIREWGPALPVIILTNVSDEGVAERFRGENRCWFLRKEDYLPFELVEEVRNILARSQKQE